MTLLHNQRKVKLISVNNKLLFSGVSHLIKIYSIQLECVGVLWVDQQELLPANMNRRELLKAHLGRTSKVTKTSSKMGEEPAVDAEFLSTELFLIFTNRWARFNQCIWPVFFILFNSLVFLVCGLCVVSDDKTKNSI